MESKKLSEEYLKKLGNRLKLIRTHLGKDQKQMSVYLKTAQSQISKLEAGNSPPTLYQLIEIKKLAEKDDYLRENLSWEWILEGKGKGIIG